ncbi:MAG TPA: EF-hand domain-containing protein [Burkholderiales bacterium]|nr:EF-hand domain-containing protein [Burkholderiales bacterium]
MRMTYLIAASAALALAMPFTARAAGDKTAADNVGAEKMFKSLDKNNDGSLSRDEVKGTPHDKDFATLDKNHDGKLSRDEHAAAPEHSGKSAATGGTSGGAMSSDKSESGASPSSSGASGKGY